MSQPAHLSWALLAVGVAVGWLLMGLGWPGRQRPVLVLVAGGLAGLSCVLVATAVSG